MHVIAENEKKHGQIAVTGTDDTEKDVPPLTDFKVQYVCLKPKCNRMFSSKNLLIDHTNRVHLTSRAHKCTKCEHSFHNVSRLNRHRILVHNEQLEDSLTCEICGREFGRKVDLVNHMRSRSCLKRNSIVGAQSEHQKPPPPKSIFLSMSVNS